MKHKGLLLSALLLSALACNAATAQTVQKCVARDGHVRYQSEPCVRGEKTAETWEAVPDAERLANVAAGPVRPRTHRARRIRTPRREVASTGSGDSCEAARAYRDAAERRAGLTRNYDLLSTLQRRVYDACR